MYNKAMADWLVAGCHSDEAISENKGPPVMTQSERCITQHTAARMFFFLPFIKRIALILKSHSESKSQTAPRMSMG
jgi:hypothetical protein